MGGGCSCGGGGRGPSRAGRWGVVGVSVSAVPHFSCSTFGSFCALVGSGATGHHTSRVSLCMFRQRVVGGVNRDLWLYKLPTVEELS